MLFEAWDDALRSTCGQYYGVPQRSRRIVEGHLDTHRVHGFDLADLKCDIRGVERTSEGIRRDDHDNLYLLFLLQGEMAVDHGAHRRRVRPGGMYLLDSARPARLGFGGDCTHLLSLHLPRTLARAEAEGVLRSGITLDPDDPAGRLLRRTLLDARKGGAAPVRNPEQLLDLVRLSFARGQEAERLLPAPESRLALALQEMESFLTRPELSLGWLAQRVGISERQLERDFRASGTGFVRELRDRRLRLACEMMTVAQRAGWPVQITEIVLASGFRDLSNFNRAFRRRQGCTPRDYLRSLARGA